MDQVNFYPNRMQIKLQYGVLGALVVVGGAFLFAVAFAFGVGKACVDWISQ